MGDVTYTRRRSRIHAAEPPSLGGELGCNLSDCKNLCTGRKSIRVERTYNLARVTCRRCLARITKYPQLRTSLATAYQPSLPGV